MTVETPPDAAKPPATGVPPVAEPPVAVPPVAVPPDAGVAAAAAQSVADAAAAAAAASVAGEVKPGDKAPPVEISLVVPKDVAVDPKVLTTLKEKAKVLGLTQAQAQDQLDTYVGFQKDAIARYEASQKNVEQQRLDALKADPEFGGANFDASKLAVEKAIVRFFTPEQAADLNKRLGSDPVLMKGLAKIGKAIAESVTVRPAQGPSPEAKTTDDLHRSLYPSMYKTG